MVKFLWTAFLSVLTVQGMENAIPQVPVFNLASYLLSSASFKEMARSDLVQKEVSPICGRVVYLKYLGERQQEHFDKLHEQWKKKNPEQKATKEISAPWSQKADKRAAIDFVKEVIIPASRTFLPENADTNKKFRLTFKDCQGTEQCVVTRMGELTVLGKNSHYLKKYAHGIKFPDKQQSMSRFLSGLMVVESPDGEVSLVNLDFSYFFGLCILKNKENPSLEKSLLLYKESLERAGVLSDSQVPFQPDLPGMPLFEQGQTFVPFPSYKVNLGLISENSDLNDNLNQGDYFDCEGKDSSEVRAVPFVELQLTTGYKLANVLKKKEELPEGSFLSLKIERMYDNFFISNKGEYNSFSLSETNTHICYPKFQYKEFYPTLLKECYQISFEKNLALACGYLAKEDDLTKLIVMKWKDFYQYIQPLAKANQLTVLALKNKLIDEKIVPPIQEWIKEELEPAIQHVIGHQSYYQKMYEKSIKDENGNVFGERPWITAIENRWATIKKR